MGIINKIGRLFGAPQWGLGEESRRQILAQSPYEITEYSVQGMALVAYLIIDPKIPVGDKQELPPANLVMKIEAEHGAKGRRRAENWIIHDALRAGGNKSG